MSKKKLKILYSDGYKKSKRLSHVILNRDDDDQPLVLSSSMCNILANHIEDYLNLYTEVFIIPESLRKHRDELDAAIKTVKKLIKKLRSNEYADVFKDMSN